MASLFRNGASSPRSPVPPSSFPGGGLHPVGSRDRQSNSVDGQRRVSRTDMDFEQALRAGGTVVLKEGPDISSLGRDTAPSPKPHPSSLSPAMPQPSTPTVVPPTPTPVTKTKNSSGSSSRPRPSSPSVSSSNVSSSNDVFYDAEDTEYQTKRRSMYRSSGTASSPDLATLVRKAKQRGGILPAHLMKEKQKEAPPPLPAGAHASDRSSPRLRPRSSTSSSTSAPHMSSPLGGKGKGKLQKAVSSNQMAVSSSSSSDWVFASPRSGAAEGGSMKNAKSSVRAKTSAFLGKMLGQGSVRERSKTDASSSSIVSAMSSSSTAPPVPPVPKEHRAPFQSPVTDVFSSPWSPPNQSKPLPLHPEDRKSKSENIDEVAFDDQSLIMVERPSVSVSRVRSRSPDKTIKSKSDPASKVPSHIKRRSMSVGDAELKKAMTATSASTPLPANRKNSEESEGWDHTMKGILSDFKGQLSQLDPISTSLDLHVPVTPERRGAHLHRAHSEIPPSLTIGRPDPPRHAATAPPLSAPPLSVGTPIVTLQPASQTDDPTPGSPDSILPIVPPRSSSLQTPPSSRARSGSGPHSRAFPPSPAHRPLGPRHPSMSSSPGHAYTGSRDSNRLWIQPRSTAFSSEPSLVPGHDVPPPLSAISQQDLSSPHALRRFPSDNRTTASEDPEDVEALGKERAAQCWDEDESFLAKEKIAEWLGGIGRVNKVALRHYLDKFDFSGLRLDMAFRRLCGKFFLKAETQQVDRILEEFSRRYWECNPGSLFGNAGVVHAVSYSLLLLNTDLHVADLATRMSKGQFVRNTLGTIQMQLHPSRSGPGSTSDLTYDDSSSLRGPGSDAGEANAGATVRPRTKRSDSITSWNSITRDVVISNLGSSLTASSATQTSSSSGGNNLTNDSTASVSNTNTSGADSKSPSTLVSSMVYDRNWESDMESLLKDMYSAVKNQQVLQPLGSMLRNRSLRVQPDRLTTLKRGSIRGIQSLMGPSSISSPFSSNSSVDGRASPSPSFATSTHEGIYGGNMAFLTPTLGFASNLSHTIIRETQEDDDRSHHSSDSESTTISISDEELALLGPPWAKEGMLCRKQYNESTGKRAKSKAWLDVFVVIQKGELSMFTFGGHGGGGHSVVGGGNWLENANLVGTVQLAHSLAHALPPPGYNRQRPHCMVLTLANGGVYFFQAGTEELVNEWVSTCNYWAARQSKEPLTGGVSNMEYGWNRVGDPTHHGRAISDDESARHDIDNMSVRSGRSSRSRFGRKDGAATVRGGSSPWADRTSINEWKAPQPPTVPSMHDEEAQLDALRRHVTSMTEELQHHNELRAPMMALYPARSANASKALGNWEKKSQYLLTEIVKYESYIGSLQAAMSLRLKKRGEKALERALHGGLSDDGLGSKSKWKGRPEGETILEGDEPSPTGVAHPRSGSIQRHRREMAEVDGSGE